nr:flagellin B [uncultured Campylobacter sp.]
MAFRINTNITAMNNHNNARKTDDRLNASLTHLSSGLRINKAADDASGMTIADSLKSQANSLGQAIANGNDAIGIVQTADGAMDEQLQIVDTIRTKAIQAAQDGQSTDSRKALQADISRLMEELDNIAKTTSFNGKQLLNGNFSNQNFQIGAYSNETVQISIGATESSKIGHTRFETSQFFAFSTTGDISAQTAIIELSGIDGFPNGYKFQDVSGLELKQNGFKAIADRLNGVSDITGVRAKVTNSITFSGVIATGTLKGLEINGAKIGDIELVAGDQNAVLVNSINAVKAQTGVEASVTDGKLTLTARDGRTMNIKAQSSYSFMGTISDILSDGKAILGSLSLIREDARDIVIGIKGLTGGAQILSTFTMATTGMSEGVLNSLAQTATVTLADLNTGILNGKAAAAMGYFRAGEFSSSIYSAGTYADQLSGVTTYGGAQAMISVAESAQKQLDRIRADIGSVQNQIVSTINNISTTQVNVKAAESQIRDVDFASEASNFNKYNLLAQSGSYALSQANTVQQNVMRLLQ